MQKVFIDDIVYELLHSRHSYVDNLRHKRIYVSIQNNYVDKTVRQVLQVLRSENGFVFEESENQSESDISLIFHPRQLHDKILFGPSLTQKSDLYQLIQEIMREGQKFEDLYNRVKDDQERYVYIKDVIIELFAPSLNYQRKKVFSGEQFRDNLFLTYKSFTCNQLDLIYFDEQYDETPKKIQKLVLPVILEIDRICKKHEIRYFLAGGTLLGAVRHKGFIPWDDDADLMMTREEFEKFEKVVEKELDQSYFWQTNKTDPSTYYPFSKIRINHTKYNTAFTYGIKDMNQGIFVDLFVHDNTSNSEFFSKIHLLLTKIFRGILVYKWTNSPMNKRPRVFSNLADKIIKSVPIRFWYKRTVNVIKKYRNHKNAHYLYDGMGEHVNNGRFPKEWLMQTHYLEFEGYSLPVPGNYREYLQFLYGDYQKPAPLSKRKAVHDIVELDFGPY